VVGQSSPVFEAIVCFLVCLLAFDACEEMRCDAIPAGVQTEQQNKTITKTSLELVRIGEVVQGESSDSGKGNQTNSGGEVSLDLVLSGGGVDLHLWLNGPDVGFSVLVYGDTSLTTGWTIVLGKESGRPGGGSNRGC